ncbi:7-deoxyloganetin glucosyltransferase-like isoform X3 [Punica granatum]|uniref:Glycosyltransferase n=1 Tax=Punica granatum TaxID=22663 RepID=A0A6P8CX52_PUNGR|nr:7-deoxyloganetin glucosyltransferase-like isoform X3 [Punica granatum]
MESEKPHAVLVPYPAQGHVNPLMQLAKLLHSRGFHITFVYTEYLRDRLVRVKGLGSVQGPPDFRFEAIPDGLPPSDNPDATQRTADVCGSTKKHSVAPFKQLLIRLNSTTDIPRVTCVISDTLMSFTVRVAQELGIFEVQFWTASACGLMGYNQYAELIRRGIVPLKDESDKSNGYLETPLEGIKAMEGLKLKHVPAFCRTTDPEDVMLNFMIEQMENCKISSGLIINTFDELEKEVLSELGSVFPPIYTIGPLHLSARNEPETRANSTMDSTLWKEEAECLEWLDRRDKRSVVYVNFGSIVVTTDETVAEFAWGLRACGFHFLWVLRPDLAMGSSAKLPEGFLEETKGKGLIATWCPQEKVLSHRSIGLFITHAGWNSLSESLAVGVPVLCFPLRAEQPTNSWSMSSVWGNGMEIQHNAKQDAIARLIKEMMIGETGKEKRERAMGWKMKAHKATSKGGSSTASLDRLINQLIHRVKI